MGWYVGHRVASGLGVGGLTIPSHMDWNSAWICWAYGSDLQPSAFGPTERLSRAAGRRPRRDRALRSEGGRERGASLRASAANFPYAAGEAGDGLVALILVIFIVGYGDVDAGLFTAGFNFARVANSSHLRHCHEGNASMARERFVFTKYTFHALAMRTTRAL
jgi:hypothetical protein